MGPLGDQIARGEMAAPTGRNKDRARMDEDEVGGFNLIIVNSRKLLKSPILMKSCPAVLRSGATGW